MVDRPNEFRRPAEGTPEGSLRPRDESSAQISHRLTEERAMDDTLADSFPASDPPSWTHVIARAAGDRE